MATMNGTLIFREPKLEDEGSYRCYAKNKHGFASFPPLAAKRTFLEGFKDDSIYIVEAKEGDPLKLTCEMPSGYPKPFVSWMIQTQSGELHTIEDSRKTFDPEGNLWFSRVSADDALKSAFYTCAATSSFRNEYKLGKRVQLKVIRAAADSSSLNFTAPTMQYVSAPHVVALRGQRTELFCIYASSSSDALNVSWSLNGTTINYDKRLKERNFGKSLLIRDTRIEDRGTYTCDVVLATDDEDESASQNQSSLIMLDVLAAPYFISHVKSKMVVENETSEVEFSCEVRGIPDPIIEWTHNGRLLDFTKGRMSALNNKLTIKDLIKSDGGNYGCNATNELGFAYQDFYLDIVKKREKETNLN
jgi:neuronal cell adhesion molecule